MVISWRHDWLHWLCAGATKTHTQTDIAETSIGRRHIPGVQSGVRQRAWAVVLTMCQACQRVRKSCAKHVRKCTTESVGGCAYHVPGMCSGVQRRHVPRCLPCARHVRRRTKGSVGGCKNQRFVGRQNVRLVKHPSRKFTRSMELTRSHNELSRDGNPCAWRANEKP